MRIYFSASTKGFYDTSLRGCVLPADAVEVSNETRWEMVNAQIVGKTISADAAGHPILIDPPAQSHDDAIKAQILALEATATPRRLREAALGIDGGWLADLEAQIDALRAQLTS